MPRLFPSVLTSAGIVRAVSATGGLGVRGRVLLVLSRTPADGEEWRRIGTAELAAAIGVDRRNAGRAVRLLVAAGVVERQKGTGRRPTGYRVRGDVWRWGRRDHRWPWAVPVEAIAAAISRAGEDVRLSDEREPAQVIPFPVSASSTAAVGASSERRTYAETAIGGGSLVRRLDDAPSGVGASSDPCAKPSLVRHSDDAATENSLLVTTPTKGGAAEPGAERENLSDDAAWLSAEPWVAAVVGAIYRKTDRPVLGKLRPRLARLAPRLALDVAIRTIGAAPVDLRPPALVAALEHEVDHPAEPAAGAEARSWLALSYTDSRGRRITEPRSFASADDAASARAALDDDHAAWLPAGATEAAVEPL